MYSEEQFDNMIKSVLEDGTEAVPEGIWAGIEGRMAGKPAGAGAWPRWLRRTVVGTAFACLAVGGVILFMPDSDDSAGRIDSCIDAVTAAVIVPEATETKIAAVPDNVPISSNYVPAASDNNIPVTSGNVPASTDNVPAASDNRLQPTAEDTAPMEHVEAGGILTYPEPEGDAFRRTPRITLSASAGTGQNAGGHSPAYGRMSAGRMDFGTAGNLTETEETSYLIPISTGIGVRFNFNDRWALGTGLNYTFLNRHFKGVYDYGGMENYQCNDVSNDQHFIGIPVEAFYTIISGNRLKFYTFFGGAVEKCLYNKYSFDYYRSRQTLKQPVAGLQISAGIGLGLQINLTDNFGICIDPRFCYYFQNYLQPKSIRTIQPFQFNIGIGLRWDI